MPLTSFKISIHGGEPGCTLGKGAGLGGLGPLGADAGGVLLVFLPTGVGRGLNLFSSARISGVSLPGKEEVEGLSFGLFFGTILGYLGLDDFGGLGGLLVGSS